MGTLRDLLATAEGCDLIIICQGDFCFVHKAVIAAQSTVLKKEACNSQFLNGEAYHIFTDIPATVFHKILSFLYRGDISDFPELRHLSGAGRASPSLEYFANTFPNTDNFLKTVVGKPPPKPSNGIPSGQDTITNPQKWSVLIGNQCQIKVFYDEKACNDSAEVYEELDILAAAQHLDILALKNSATRKVMAWIEKELQSAPPLSEDLYKVTDFVLRKEKSFVKPFFSLYAKFFPTIGMNLSLSTLLKDLDKDTFDMFAELHSQWMNERNRLDEELEQNTRKATILETEVNLLKSQAVSAEKTYKTGLENLKEVLKYEKRKEIALAAKVELLENMNKSLQMDLIAARVSNMKTKENNPPRADNQLVKYKAAEDREKARLKMLLSNVQDALRQHKGAHRQITKRLKSDNQKLNAQLNDLKASLHMFMEDVNESGHCHGCKRQWNFVIDHGRSGSIKMSCTLCLKEAWYYEDH